MMVDKKAADEPRDDEPDKGIIAASPYEAPMGGHMFLGDVIYWVASEGHDHHPNDQDEAAQSVFNAIDCGRFPVEGLNEKNEPEVIPSGYFSNVTTVEPSETQAFFSPVEDKFPLTQFGGTLTLPREQEPKWRRIRCEVAEVINIWPKSWWSATAVPKTRPGDSELVERINAVIQKAKPRVGSHSYRRMAALICKASQTGDGKFEGFSQSTVIKILTDNYGPMNRLGIKADISAKDRAAKK